MSLTLLLFIIRCAGPLFDSSLAHLPVRKRIPRDLHAILPKVPRQLGMVHERLMLVSAIGYKGKRETNKKHRRMKK